MNINRFNIRVYSVIFNEQFESVLLSDELIAGKPYTKFPGGGLEFGEGTLECAKREAIEELGQELKILSHLYTTDFFQPSYFRKEDQIISVYYAASLQGPVNFRLATERFEFDPQSTDKEAFRWLNLENLIEDELSFPIDRKIIPLIKEFALVNQ